MSELDEKFFSENLQKINKLVHNLLISANAVPLLLYLLSAAKIFGVDTKSCLYLLAITSIASLTDYFLIKFNHHKAAVYFGLVSLEFIIAGMGMHLRIGIYMTFGLVPIMASLYYNKKLTLRLSAFSYVLMLVSLYLKFRNGGAIFYDQSRNLTFREAYIPVACGFTVEFIFITLAANMLSRRNYQILLDLMSSLYNGKKVLEDLRKTKNLFENKNKELETTQYKIIQFVAECLGSHDLFTGRHVSHTKEYVSLIAKKLRENGWYAGILDDQTIKLYSSAAFLHDIGKIHIPEGILNKVGKFTDEEFERMKSHPEEGRKLLEFLPKIDDGRFNEIAIEMAHCHHEKWNGTGYPRRIAGEDIPLCARIMAAADVLDALISQRLYKEPMSVDEAMKVFKESSGTHFEPCIAEAVIACRDTIQVIDSQFKEEESAENNKELQWWYRYHNINKEDK